MNLLESFLFLDFFYKGTGYAAPAMAITQISAMPAAIAVKAPSEKEIQQVEFEYYFNKKLPFNIHLNDNGEIDAKKFVRSVSTEIAQKFLLSNHYGRVQSDDFDEGIKQIYSQVNYEFSDEEKRHFSLVLGGGDKFSDLLPQNISSLLGYAHYLHFEEKANANAIIDILRSLSSKDMDGRTDYLSMAKDLLEQYYVPQKDIDIFSVKMVSSFNYDSNVFTSKYNKNIYFEGDSERLYSELINYSVNNKYFGDFIEIMADKLRFKIVEPRELLDFIHSLNSDNKLGLTTLTLSNDPRGISVDLLEKRFKDHLNKFNAVNTYRGN